MNEITVNFTGIIVDIQIITEDLREIDESKDSSKNKCTSIVIYKIVR